jgi:hypothetical protein
MRTGSNVRRKDIGVETNTELLMWGYARLPDALSRGIKCRRIPIIWKISA